MLGHIKNVRIFDNWQNERETVRLRDSRGSKEGGERELRVVGKGGHVATWQHT